MAKKSKDCSSRADARLQWTRPEKPSAAPASGQLALTAPTPSPTTASRSPLHSAPGPRRRPGPLRSRKRRPLRARASPARIEISQQAAAHRNLSLDAAQPPHGVRARNLYKQSKVVGGVYFGLGQEACSCASAYALQKDDWLGPMIRNQGSMLVRGFSPRDIMMQYMAKAGSPDQRPRRLFPLRRPSRPQRRLADFNAGRPDPRARRRGSRRAAARQATSRS